MYLDAIAHGNITRFINHAPNDKPKSSTASLLEANVETQYGSSNGIHVVLYVARKDILPGEQLLIDYGQKYFDTRPLILFKTNGQLVNSRKKLFFWRHSQNKLNYLKIMADHGVKKAQHYMRIRIFIIVFIIILLMNALHLLH